MDIKDIKAIIDLMKKNSVTEFELEKDEFKIRLKRGNSGGLVASYDDAPGASYPSQPTVSSPIIAPPVLVAPTAISSEIDIKSPMIGTFYRSPSPESAPYVEVGTEVNPDTVVCIIEAMKVMNEIKAEARGVITQVLLDNAKTVDFGQPLFKLRPV